MTKLSAYPDASEFDSFITWPVLEEALTQHMAKMEEMRRRKEVGRFVFIFSLARRQIVAKRNYCKQFDHGILKK